MSFAFRTALAVLLLVAAQGTFALDSTIDSGVRAGVERAEPASKTRAADRAAELTKARSTDELYRQSGSGFMSKPATEPSSGIQSAELSSADKGGVSISVFKSFEGITCSGEEILYTIGLANASAAGDALSASITETLDQNVNLVGGSITSVMGSAAPQGNDIVWTGTLGPGQSNTITFRVTIKNVPNGTQIQNDPRFVLGPFDLRLSEFPKGSPLFFEVDCAGGGTIAALGTKSVFSPDGGCPGDSIFYTITLTNLSSDPPGELPGRILDFLDDDVNIESASATDVDFNVIGTLDVNFNSGRVEWTGNLDVSETVFINIVAIVKDVPDWTLIENDPFYELGPLQFLLPIPIVIPTICADFIIDEGVTGSYSDTVYNGQGINVEILAKDEDGFSGLALVYWYTYDSFGLPFFAFGVGTYVGNIMVVDMLFDYDGAGPFFGPGWDNDDFESFDFTQILLLWKDCDKLGFFFNDLPGLLALDFPWYLMNMVRITQVAGIPCPFQDLGPLSDKQLEPVQNPVSQQVARPALKPLFDALPDSTLDRAGGRERVYEKLGLNAQPAAKPAPRPEPAMDTEEEKGGFQIGIGMTGSFYDPNFNGQGINTEILSVASNDKGLVSGGVLMYWYTYDINGFPMFVFGVGSFSGNTMIFEMFVDWDGNGPIFGPLWDPSQFIPILFANATIVWSGCDFGVMTFTMHPTFAGFGFVAHIMNLERITSISKIECVD